ncbi:MAG TPA: DUF4203 domain-containing protein [Microlunatus sp.]|nr:DUF4203 domain-containing protein [Microlunatus sp.]
MDAVVVGVIAVLIGALLCFRGYVTMRLIISLFGAFVGFLLGAGLVAGVTDSGFGQLALSWLVGIVGAVIFGVLAYFSYQVAVVIGLAGIGFTIGTSVMAAVGVGSQMATIAVGLVVGALLAVIAVATDLPAVILVVLTALAGASVTVAGVMVIAGAIGLNRLTVDGVSAEMSGGWWWYVLYGGLALLGIVAQLRALSGGPRSMRQQWGSSVPAGAAIR